MRRLRMDISLSSGPPSPVQMIVNPFTITFYPDTRALIHRSVVPEYMHPCIMERITVVTHRIRDYMRSSIDVQVQYIHHETSNPEIRPVITEDIPCNHSYTSEFSCCQISLMIKHLSVQYIAVHCLHNKLANPEIHPLRRFIH
jgi:hypothetical protein